MMLPLLALICWSFVYVNTFDHEFMEEVAKAAALVVCWATLVILGLLLAVGLFKLFDKGFGMACKRTKNRK